MLAAIALATVLHGAPSGNYIPHVLIPRDSTSCGGVVSNDVIDSTPVLVGSTPIVIETQPDFRHYRHYHSRGLLSGLGDTLGDVLR